MLHKKFRAIRAILMLHKGYTKFIMPAGIMSPARIIYIGLTGYPMIHPVINRINSNPVKFRMDDWIFELIRFGAHLYTGQWYLKQICDDKNYHYLYCDLTIKNPDSPHLEALLELLATASISKLNGHFEQVFKYEEQLHSREIWIVHFSH